jgi:hypothetical protein
MTTTKKVLLYAGIYFVGYQLWKYYSKPKSVLVKGSDADTPEKVEYSTGKEGMLGSDGSLDTMINLKKPIYVRPRNSIPSVYDRGIGDFINASGCDMNATGFHENLATACNAKTVRKLGATSIDIPIIPQN